MSSDSSKPKVIEHKSECTWAIHAWEATSTWSSDRKLTSEIFSSPTNDGTKWCLEIHPTGSGEGIEQNGYFFRTNMASVYLRLVSIKTGSVTRAKFDLYSLNEEDTKVNLFTMGPETVNINTNPRMGKRDAFARPEPYNRSSYGPNDLELVCYVVEYVDIADDLWDRSIIVPECQINEDYRVLLETKAFSDVKIITRGNIEFEAHKAILTVRSPVFTATFKHDMTEQSNNCIELMDTDPKILEEMLRFIYTGKVGNINEMAMDLLAVADKYDLQRLKNMCEEKLRTAFSVENAAHIFMIADRYSCKQLKTLIGSFISKHVKEVIQTESYSLMIKSYPQFAEKLVHEMFS